MNQKSHEKPQELKLEETIVLGNGRTCARCQARNSSGEQCKSPARKGFKVCSKHGAGYRVREERGEKKPVSIGRPRKAQNELASQSQILEIQQRRLEDKAALDNTDEALAALQALVEFLVSRSGVGEKFGELEELVPMLEAAADKFREEAELSPDEMGKPDYNLINEARTAMKLIPTAFRLATQVRQLLDDIGVAASRVTKAAKERAEVKLKLAEADQLEMLRDWISISRGVILEMSLSDEQRQFYESQLKLRLFGQLGGQLPAPRGDYE